MNTNPPTPAADRVLARSTRNAEGCLIFTGATNEQGYGIIFTGSKADGTNRHAKAHRVVYEARYGATTQELDHRCHTEALAAGRCEGGLACPHRRCVDPDHLEPVTDAEQGIRKRRRKCRNGHDLPHDNPTQRWCPTCRQAWDRTRVRDRSRG